MAVWLVDLGVGVGVDGGAGLLNHGVLVLLRVDPGVVDLTVRVLEGAGHGATGAAGRGSTLRRLGVLHHRGVSVNQARSLLVARIRLDLESDGFRCRTGRDLDGGCLDDGGPLGLSVGRRCGVYLGLGLPTHERCLVPVGHHLVPVGHRLVPVGQNLGPVAHRLVPAGRRRVTMLLLGVHVSAVPVHVGGDLDDVLFLSARGI